MAEEKKESKGSKRYGHGPKIEPKESAGNTDKAVAPKKAARAAEKTAGKPSATSGYKEHAETPGDGLSSSKVAMGTDGVEVEHRHAGERSDLHYQHMMEHGQMHARHEGEHAGHKAGEKKAMHERHHHEKREMHTHHEHERKKMHDRHEAELSGAEAPKANATEGEGEGGTEP